MPFLDSFPLGWLKMSECACLVQILHMLMVIDANQNTLNTFERIKEIAQEDYRKHFDQTYEFLPKVKSIPAL
jgi:CO dehydrogenase nickel-insertion accessory protein CooC1